MLTLLRVESTEIVTRGCLLVDGRFICLTLENPWKENSPNVSCIPTGQYQLVPYVSLQHGATYKLLGVPNREGIIVHVGNTEDNTRGCVLLGMEVGTLDGQPAVLQSRKAFNRFLNIMEVEKHDYIHVVSVGV